MRNPNQVILRRLYLGCAVFMFVLAAVLVWAMNARARDNGQWSGGDSTTHDWVRSLTQPDNPYQSCCADADAYWADDYTVNKAGETVVTITDDRDDAPLGRPHRPSGTQWIVPDSKIKWDRGNPSGHGWLFLSYEGRVYCWVAPGGV